MGRADSIIGFDRRDVRHRGRSQNPFKRKPKSNGEAKTERNTKETERIDASERKAKSVGPQGTPTSIREAPNRKEGEGSPIRVD